MIEIIKHPSKPKPLDDGDRMAVIVIMWMERGVYGKKAMQLARWGVEPREVEVEC